MATVSQSQSPPQAARASKNHEVYSRNAKLFKSVKKTFQNSSASNYEKFKSDTHKLSKYLSDSRGYYEEARPEIINLIIAVQHTLMKDLDAPAPESLSLQVFQTHPIGKCLVQLMTAIRPHVQLFVEPENRAIVIESLRLVGLEPLQTPGPTTSAPMAAPPRNQTRSKSVLLPASSITLGLEHLSPPVPLSAGSWSVPAHIASQSRAQPVAPPNQPTTIDPRQLEITIPTSHVGMSSPQESRIVGASGAPATAASSSAGSNVTPPIPTTQPTMQSKASSGPSALSPAVTSEISFIGAAQRSPVPSTGPTSVSAAPRLKKRKKGLDIATLRQRDIESLKQRQGLAGSSLNTTGLVVVKTEEVTTPTVPKADQAVDSSIGAVPSGIQPPKRTSVIHDIPEGQRVTSEASVPVHSSTPETRPVIVPVQDDEMQITGHKLPSAVPSATPFIQEDTTVKTEEEVHPIPAQPAASPQPQTLTDASMEPAAILDVSIQQPILQESAIAAAELQLAPETQDPAASGQIPANIVDEPSAERDTITVPQPHLEEEAPMEIDPPVASATIEQHVFQISTSQSTDTAVSMDLESVSDAPSQRQPTPTPPVVYNPNHAKADAEPAEVTRAGSLEGELLMEETNPLPKSTKTLPLSEDAMNVDQRAASALSPEPRSPAPPDNLFGDDLRTIVFKEGTPDNTSTKLVMSFDLPSEDATLARRWWDQTGILSKLLRETLCLSLGCYPADQLDLSQPLGPQLRCIRSQWPQGGGLSFKLGTSGQSIHLPLAPPFTVTPENTFDVSSLTKAGQNTFEIIQSKDYSQHVFALFLHRPTRKQMDKVKSKRKADDDWESWKVEMAKPLPLKLKFIMPPRTLGTS